MNQMTQTEAEIEQMHDEASGASIDVASSADIEGAEGLRSTLEDGASEFDVTSFECADCGTVHSHDSTKHKLSDTFESMDADTAASELDMNPVGHCGYVEAAFRGDELGLDTPSPEEAFNTAPVPDETWREMKEKFA